MLIVNIMLLFGSILMALSCFLFHIRGLREILMIHESNLIAGLKFESLLFSGNYLQEV